MEQSVTQDSIERVNAFLKGRDPMEHIVAMECDYQSDKVDMIYINANGEKRIARGDFKPFAWVKQSAASRLFGGDRPLVAKTMKKYGIACKKLRVSNGNGTEVNPRLDNGYKYMFYATRKMPYGVFIRFFEEGGVPIYNKKGKEELGASSSKEIITVSPIEQYMISTGKRLFKGYEQYDELKRLLLDLETQGLNPRIHAIDQIGIRNNKCFEKIITITGETQEERRANELKGIIQFLQILKDEKPDIVAGHNSENFDWNFIIVRCEELGTSIQELSRIREN